MSYRKKLVNCEACTGRNRCISFTVLKLPFHAVSQNHFYFALPENEEFSHLHSSRKIMLVEKMMTNFTLFPLALPSMMHFLSTYMQVGNGWVSAMSCLLLHPQAYQATLWYRWGRICPAKLELTTNTLKICWEAQCKQREIINESSNLSWE